jgi:hypothetical protein
MKIEDNQYATETSIIIGTKIISQNAHMFHFPCKVHEQEH